MKHKKQTFWIYHPRYIPTNLVSNGLVSFREEGVTRVFQKKRQTSSISNSKGYSHIPIRTKSGSNYPNYTVKTSKTDVIVFIGIKRHIVTSYWLILSIITILFIFPLMFKTNIFHITQALRWFQLSLIAKCCQGHT